MQNTYTFFFVYDKDKKELRRKENTIEWMPGRGTFMTMLKYVTEPTTSKACLSYYYIRLLDTFQLYDNLVEDMMRLQEGALQDFETKRGHSLASEKNAR